MVMMLMLFMLMLMLLMLMVMTRRWGVFAPRGNQLQINSCHGASAFLALGVTPVHTCLPTLNALMYILVHVYTLTCQLIHMALHKRIHLRARRIMLYTCSRVWLSLKAATWLEVAFDWNREKVDQWVLAASARWGDGGQKGGEGVLWARSWKTHPSGAKKLRLCWDIINFSVKLKITFKKTIFIWLLAFSAIFFSQLLWQDEISSQCIFFLFWWDQISLPQISGFSRCSLPKFSGFEGFHYLNFQGFQGFPYLNF